MIDPVGRIKRIMHKAAGSFNRETDSLEAISDKLDSIAGGAFWGSYGPRNVEADNDVDFGIIIYDPSGNIITTGGITPGTYTVHRIRVAVDTEIVSSTASSEAAGRVYMTYDFPSAGSVWLVGDIFYITFSGIEVTIGGITTQYPDLYIWGRVVREADISDKVDDIEAKLDKLAGEAPVEDSVEKNWNTAVDSPDGTGGLLVDLGTAATRKKLHSLLLDVSALTDGAVIHVKLFIKINGTQRKVYDETFTIGTDPPGLWVINGSLVIHDILSVAIYSDTNESKAVGYTCCPEAM